MSDCLGRSTAHNPIPPADLDGLAGEPDDLGPSVISVISQPAVVVAPDPRSLTGESICVGEFCGCRWKGRLSHSSVLSHQGRKIIASAACTVPWRTKFFAEERQKRDDGPHGFENLEHGEQNNLNVTVCLQRRGRPMPDTILYDPEVAAPIGWSGDITRVPFRVYRDRTLLHTEQERVFEGPVWNFLCLEDEIANSGDWRTTLVGQMPVVVVRDGEGEIAAFENRCAHRGALICLDNAGRSAKDFQCVYHAWRYDLRGNLKSVAFRHGVNGRGGMPPGFRVEQHGPRQLRVTTLHGLVFGTFSDQTPAIEDFIGPEVLARFDRILGGRKVEIIGRFVEVLPNNWKIYAENARDSYHASLLHLFFATFKLNRLSQGGGLVVSANGGCSVSETIAPTQSDDPAYAGMRSVT
jgi:nitrite reductase/ring-hydroxylating ferredoxin subunit